MYHSRDALSQSSGYPETLAAVTLSTFYLGKHDLLTLYLEKFYRLDLGYVSKTIEFTLTATPKQ